MIDVSVMASVVVSLVSLAGLWLFVRTAYQHYWLDKVRADLFEVRDDLFDLAAAGRVAFSHPAYHLLRTTLNGYLRFGDKLSMTNVVLHGMAFGHDVERDSGWKQWRSSLRALPAEEQRALRKLEVRMSLAVIRFIVFRSTVLVLMIVPAVVLLVAATRIVVAMTPLLRRLDDAALQNGQKHHNYATC